MLDFLARLFDTSGFPDRWHCGEWSPGLGWLHIASDVAIWGAYMSIPLMLAYFVLARKKDLPLVPVFWLFAAFIFSCGTTHLVDAMLFWWPAYRFFGVMKLITAVVSWGTVIALIHYLPIGLALPGLARTNERLRAEIAERQVVEEKLRAVQERLEEMVAERTAELEREVAVRRAAEADLKAKEEALRRSYAEMEERVRARTLELGAANERLAALAAIVESSDDAIMARSPKGEVVSWNPGAERMYGYAAEEMIGRSIEPIVPSDLQDELERLSGENRGITRMRTRRRCRDGRIIHVSLTVSPILDQTGRMRGTSTIARDITDEVRREQEVRQYARRLEISNADLQQFAYVASHDLKAPLRAVAGFVQLLQRRYAQRLDDEGRGYIAGAVESVDRMTQLINDLLALSRVQRADRSFVEVPLEELLRKALSNLSGEIAEAGAEVTHDPLPTIHGDPTMLGQLLQNLIGNAVKFRRDGIAPRVHLAAVRHEDEWELSVQDNGIGIEPRYADRIFEVFKRLHGSTKYAGTGIGLAICKKIVERHGGRIWVESQKGDGATFLFTIPT